MMALAAASRSAQIKVAIRSVQISRSKAGVAHEHLARSRPEPAASCRRRLRRGRVPRRPASPRSSIRICRAGPRPASSPYHPCAPPASASANASRQDQRRTDDTDARSPHRSFPSAKGRCLHVAHPDLDACPGARARWRPGFMRRVEALKPRRRAPAPEPGHRPRRNQCRGWWVPCTDLRLIENGGEDVAPSRLVFSAPNHAHQAPHRSPCSFAVAIIPPMTFGGD